MIVASNYHSYSPLIVYIKNNQVEAVHYLSERVDVNEQPYKMMPSYIFGGERHWADKDEMWASYEERYEERSDESAVFVAMHSSTNQEIKNPPSPTTKAAWVRGTTTQGSLAILSSTRG